MTATIFNYIFHHPRLGYLFRVLHQLPSDVFFYVSLSATGTDARGHIIDHELHFATRKSDGRETVNRFSLPANEAIHKDKTN
jgi:hypothetical protein